MNESQRDLICLLKNSISHVHEKLGTVDYAEIKRIAVNHACLPLVYDGATKAGLVPPESWEQHAIFVAANNYKNLSVQAEILATLSENHIRHAVLKGISVSRYYPEPLYRPLGDIDILVDESEYERAITLITGSAERTKEQHEHEFHYCFLHKGVHVEIHRKVTNFASDARGKKLRAYFSHALDNLEEGRYDTFSFPTLSPAFSMVSLVLHLQRHFVIHNTTLRMLCDFAAFAQSIEKEVWHSSVLPVLTDMELLPFAEALLCLCEKHLGIKLSFSVSLREEDLADALLDSFLQDGIHKTYRPATKKNVFTTIKSVFRAVAELARRRYKILKKHPALLPVFCVYIPLAKLWRMALGKRSSIIILDYSMNRYEREELAKKLKM